MMLILDGIQHINVPKSQISYTVSWTVVAQLLCKELVCMTRMNVEYTFEPHVHMPCLNGKTCPHENTFCEIGEKLSENAHHVCSGYAYICYRRAVHYFLAKLVLSPDAKGFLCQKLGPKIIGCHPHYWWACPPNASQYDLCSFEELFDVCF